MNSNKKLEKIGLDKVEMRHFFGGKQQGTNTTSKNTHTPENPNCSDTDTTTDNSDGSVTTCEDWTCPHK